MLSELLNLTFPSLTMHGHLSRALGKGKKPADETGLPMGWAQTNARNQTDENELKQRAQSTDCIRVREKSRFLTKIGFAGY